MSDCRKAPVSDEIKKAMTPSMARPVKDSGYTPFQVRKIGSGKQKITWLLPGQSVNFPCFLPFAPQAIATVACGCVFGFALHKAGVYKAGVIRDQFRFHDNTMLKVLSAVVPSMFSMSGSLSCCAQVFLSATATSIVGVTIMYGLKATKEQMQAIGNCVVRGSSNKIHHAIAADMFLCLVVVSH